MNLLSVSEFASKIKRNETTVRRAVKSGRLKFKESMVNNKPAYKIYDINDNYKVFGIEPPEEVINDTVVDGHIEEAEIMDGFGQNQLMTMEQLSFDALIKNIKELSDDRAKTLEVINEEIRAEVHEGRAKIIELTEKLTIEKIKAAQFEAEVRILNLRFTEKDDKIEKLEKYIKELEEKLSKFDDQQIKINSIEQQLNNSPWWSKKL